MFVNRWQMLRCPIASSIGLNKTCQLVMCLARLHNFCINERVGLDKPLATDQVEVTSRGGIPLIPVEMNEHSPAQLLRGGHHFDDIDPLGT